MDDVCKQATRLHSCSLPYHGRNYYYKWNHGLIPQLRAHYESTLMTSAKSSSILFPHVHPIAEHSDELRFIFTKTSLNSSERHSCPCTQIFEKGPRFACKHTQGCQWQTRTNPWNYAWRMWSKSILCFYHLIKSSIIYRVFQTKASHEKGDLLRLFKMFCFFQTKFCHLHISTTLFSYRYQMTGVI